MTASSSPLVQKGVTLAKSLDLNVPFPRKVQEALTSLGLVALSDLALLKEEVLPDKISLQVPFKNKALVVEEVGASMVPNSQLVQSVKKHDRLSRLKVVQVVEARTVMVAEPLVALPSRCVTSGSLVPLTSQTAPHKPRPSRTSMPLSRRLVELV